MTTERAATRLHLLDHTNSHIDARARAFAINIRRELLRWSSRVVETLIGTMVRKDNDDRDFEQRLLRLYEAYGVRQYDDAGRRASTIAGGVWTMPPQWQRDYVESKEPQIQRLVASTRQAARDSVREIIAQADREEPRPSAGEVARRIRNQFHGEAGGTPTSWREVGGDGVLSTDRIWTDDGSLYAFSSERAALISRTELCQVENTGIHHGYVESGIKEIEWLSYPDDGRSGRRQHYLMNGVRCKVGEMFTTPMGNELSYPGDPDGDIEETANCRCTQAPVLNEVEGDDE